LASVVCSESVDLRGQARLAVRGVVLVQNTLRNGLVELAGGHSICLLRFVLLAGSNVLANDADVGPNLGPDSLVALTGLVVGLGHYLSQFDHSLVLFGYCRYCASPRPHQVRMSSLRCPRIRLSHPPTSPTPTP